MQVDSIHVTDICTHMLQVDSIQVTHIFTHVLQVDTIHPSESEGPSHIFTYVLQVDSVSGCVLSLPRATHSSLYMHILCTIPDHHPHHTYTHTDVRVRKPPARSGDSMFG